MSTENDQLKDTFRVLAPSHEGAEGPSR